jgi:hypothetical protein
MIARDLLVASVAFGLGVSMLQVAFANRGWCFETMVVRQIESSRGRSAARKAVGFFGSCIVLLGAWTAASPLLFNNDGINLNSPERTAVQQKTQLR